MRDTANSSGEIANPDTSSADHFQIDQVWPLATGCPSVRCTFHLPAVYAAGWYSCALLSA
jgi:hypothetical protein